MARKSTELAAPSISTALYRQATDVANVCKEIVTKTAVVIEDRKYVKVEGWTSIAVAHGCICTIKSVTEEEKGVLAVAELRRQSDGKLLSTAEGFVGKDEPTWYGGELTRWDKIQKVEKKKTLPKRADYAIRAMAQTRAVSRVCRTAFAHVVVLMDAGLSTVPAEEMVDEDHGAGDHGREEHQQRRAAADAVIDGASKVEPIGEDKAAIRKQFEGGKWKEVVIHFTTGYKGHSLGSLDAKKLAYWVEWQPKAFGNKPISQDDVLLRAALDVAAVESAPQ